MFEPLLSLFLLIPAWSANDAVPVNPHSPNPTGTMKVEPGHPGQGSSLAYPQNTQGKGTFADERERTSATQILFKPGSYQLDTSAKAQLEEFYRSALRRGVIDQIRIVSWGDQPYPAKGKKLTKEERDLADKRNDSVKAFLAERTTRREGIALKTFSMAERPSLLKNFFGGEEKRVKNSLQSDGLVGSDRPQQSLAMVLAILK